jgi:ribosomal protein S18 acetylase RimI-like enzyme
MIRIEAISEKHFAGTLSVMNQFIRNRLRKRLCCILPLGLFPTTMTQFRRMYGTPDAMSTTAIAIRESDDKVVGFVQMTDRTMTRDPINICLHSLDEDECYIEMMSVLPEVRGYGVGTRLLHFCESRARERGANKLTLGVVAGNPAKRLYERFGFNDVDEDCISKAMSWVCLFSLFGLPHCLPGGSMMEKMIN